MKKFSIIALIILSVVIIIFATDILFLWIPIIGHTPDYGSKASAFFMAVTAFITLLLAYATFHSTEQSNLRENERMGEDIAKENRERRRNVLDKIVDFVIDIRNVPIKSGLATTKKEQLVIEFKEMLEYAGLLNKVMYIGSLCTEEFKGEIETNFNKIAGEFAAYIYTNAIANKMLGFENILVPGSTIITEIEESLKSGNSADKLVIKYGDDMTNSCREFFITAAKIRASL